MRQVKTAHRKFPNKHLAKLMRYMDPENWCVFKTTVQLGDDLRNNVDNLLTMFAISYKYSCLQMKE